MIGSVKDWASAMGYERETDEKTMAARVRILARTLGYLEDHFSDPEALRPPEQAVIEFGQFLVLAEGMEAKPRAAKFKELHDTVVALHLDWDGADRDAAFQEIARKAALLKGMIAFADAWLGTTTPIPRTRQPALAVHTPHFDDSDVKTRIVRPSQMRP